jgi:hypothetical protein
MEAVSYRPPNHNHPQLAPESFTPNLTNLSKQYDNKNLVRLPDINLLDSFNNLEKTELDRLTTYYQDKLLGEGRNNLQATLDMIKRDELKGGALEWYLNADIKNFLGEYSGAVHKTVIPYAYDHKTGDIMQGSYNVTNMLIKSEEEDKKNGLLTERTKAENEGFLSAMKELNTTDATAVLFLSPPKIADYSFANLLIKKSDGTIENILIRYDEKQGLLDKSRSILKKLGVVYPSPEELTTDTMFLRRHVAFHNKTDEVVSSVVDAIGYNQNTLLYSDKFFHKLDTTLKDTISTYTKSLQEDQLLGKVSARSEQLLSYIFLLSLSLAEEVKKEVNEHANELREKITSRSDVFSSSTLSTNVSGALYTNMSSSIASSDCDRGGFSPNMMMDMMGGRFAPTNMMGGMMDMYTLVAINPYIVALYPTLVRFHMSYRGETETRFSSFACSGGRIHDGGLKAKPVESMRLEEKIAFANSRLNQKSESGYSSVEIKNGICQCGCNQDLSCGMRENMAKWKKELQNRQEKEQSLQNIKPDAKSGTIVTMLN